MYSTQAEVEQGGARAVAAAAAAAAGLWWWGCFAWVVGGRRKARRGRNWGRIVVVEVILSGSLAVSLVVRLVG